MPERGDPGRSPAGDRSSRGDRDPGARGDSGASRENSRGPSRSPAVEARAEREKGDVGRGEGSKGQTPNSAAPSRSPAVESDDARRGENRGPPSAEKWDFNTEDTPDGREETRDNKDGTTSRSSLNEQGEPSTTETVNTGVDHAPKPKDDPQP